MARPKNFPNAHPPEFWQEIASSYNQEVESGGLRGAVLRLSEQRGVRSSQMSALVRYARIYGYLAPYVARQCPRCRQPLVPGAIPELKQEWQDTPLEQMETAAGDYAEICDKLGLMDVARSFNKAAQLLSEMV